MKSFVKVQQCAIVIFVFFCCPAILKAAPAFFKETEANAYLILAERFTWLEFNENGSRHLKEAGSRYGAGFTFNYEFSDHHLIFKPRVELIGGALDYNGETQAGVPVQDRTVYIEAKLEADLGRKFRFSQNASIEPFAGLGFRRWDKDFLGGTDSSGNHVDGYIENWQTLYLRAGARGNIPLGEKSKLFAEAGVKYPIFNEVTRYLSDVNVTLRPGNEPSLFAEAGIKYRFLKAGMYYDSMRFSKSDTVYHGGVAYYQRKTDAEMFGVRVGASF